jgi:hypothetical protein
MFIFGWSALLTPQKPTLDSGQHVYRQRTLSWFGRLPPQFQFSMSAAALAVYLYGQPITSVDAPQGPYIYIDSRRVPPFSLA